MSTSERVLMEADLADQIEGEFSAPTILTDPNGKSYAISAMVLYDARRETVNQQGEVILNKELVVTYRQTSVPAAFLLPVERGNFWKIAVPQHANSATMTTYVLEGSKNGELGNTIGTIRVYPKKILQGAIAS